MPAWKVEYDEAVNELKKIFSPVAGARLLLLRWCPEFVVIRQVVGS